MFYSFIFVLFFSLLSFCFTGYVLAADCKFNVKLNQYLHNEGFHRNITYGIVFNAENEREQWLYRDCIVGLNQELPPGVYVNADELEDLQRTQKLNAVPKNKVNIELPAEESETSSVYVMGKVRDGKVYLWLPVHARYHRAAPGGGMMRNDIPPPKLYLRCPDQRLNVCDQTISQAAIFLCNGSSKEICSWKEIPYTRMSESPAWYTPIGNTHHYYIVATGTALVVVTGSLYLLKIIHEYKLGEKKKKH